MILFFTSIVPILKKELEPAMRIQIMKATGKRFAIVSWVAIAILIATGLLKVINVAGEHHGSPAFWTVLGVKLTLVVIAVIMSVFHDFVLGPRLSKPREGDNPLTLRRKTIILARVHFLVVLIIVLLGVILMWLHFGAEL